MPERHPIPFDHPAAWKASEFGAKDDFAVDLEDRHLRALEAALDRFGDTPPGLGEIDPESFPLTAIQNDIRAWREEVWKGRGLLLLRGFPVADVPFPRLRAMYLGLGVHFGRPVSQSALGDLVGDVVDVGGKDARERAYRNSRELNLHTDRCDHLAMLCIRPAARGGISGIASALAVHNTILAERPELLAPLYRGYFHHRFGEQPPGEPPVTGERIPIFSVTDEVASVIYIRGYIDLAVAEGHVALSETELEALDFMDQVANRPEIRLEFRLEPGEVSFVNNCLLLHTRTAFEDAAEPASKRHLLRLWLREDDRPMAPGVALHKGRAGIEARRGKGTYYTPARTEAG